MRQRRSGGELRPQSCRAGDARHVSPFSNGWRVHHERQALFREHRLFADVHHYEPDAAFGLRDTDPCADAGSHGDSITNAQADTSSYRNATANFDAKAHRESDRIADGDGNPQSDANPVGF